MEASPPLFLIVISLSGVLSQCSSYSGPSGVTECIQSSHYYNQYQWATCLTNTYIGVKSNGGHECRDSTATYCYYQCMLESYGKGSGFVNSACSCKPGDKYTGQNLRLPSKCYSPSGTSCGWYLDCLKKKYPCTGTGDDYALNYATKFCDFYDKHYSRFSQEGQEWVDSVRKCYQVALVPIIRPYSDLSCTEVKKTAFDSHVPCYVKPDGKDDNVTICKLDIEDLWKVLLTVKSSLTISYDSSIESMANLFATMKKCFRVYSHQSFTYNVKIRNLRMKVTFHKNSTGNKKIANNIGNHIAKQLGWENRGIAWFTYISNASVSNSESDLFIFLADRSHYDLNADDFSSANLSEVVANFQNQFTQGKISAESYLKFSASTLSECWDINCKLLTAFHIAPQNSNGATFSKRQISGQLILCFLICISFISI